MKSMWNVIILMKYASLHILCGYARMEIQYGIYEF